LTPLVFDLQKDAAAVADGQLQFQVFRADAATQAASAAAGRSNNAAALDSNGNGNNNGNGNGDGDGGGVVPLPPVEARIGAATVALADVIAPGALEQVRTARKENANFI
jgi:hypothetical protein